MNTANGIYIEWLDLCRCLERICEDTEMDFDYVYSRTAEIPSADVRPVVRCRDCKFWHDDYVRQNDGAKRKYRDDDVDPLGIKNSVTLDIGINCGAMCCVEDGKGWGMNKRVFRQADDFCSRGELRPCSYDEWWGIVDGVYPEEDKP